MDLKILESLMEYFEENGYKTDAVVKILDDEDYTYFSEIYGRFKRTCLERVEQKTRVVKPNTFTEKDYIKTPEFSMQTKEDDWCRYNYGRIGQQGYIYAFRLIDKIGYTERVLELSKGGEEPEWCHKFLSMKFKQYAKDYWCTYVVSVKPDGTFNIIDILEGGNSPSSLSDTKFEKEVGLIPDSSGYCRFTSPLDLYIIPSFDSNFFTLYNLGGKYKVIQGGYKFQRIESFERLIEAYTARKQVRIPAGEIEEYVAYSALIRAIMDTYYSNKDSEDSMIAKLMYSEMNKHPIEFLIGLYKKGVLQEILKSNNVKQVVRKFKEDAYGRFSLYNFFIEGNFGNISENSSAYCDEEYGEMFRTKRDIDYNELDLTAKELSVFNLEHYIYGYDPFKSYKDVILNNLEEIRKETGSYDSVEDMLYILDKGLFLDRYEESKTIQKRIGVLWNKDINS